MDSNADFSPPPEVSSKYSGLDDSFDGFLDYQHCLDYSGAGQDPCRYYCRPKSRLWLSSLENLTMSVGPCLPAGLPLHPITETVGIRCLPPRGMGFLLLPLLDPWPVALSYYLRLLLGPSIGQRKAIHRAFPLALSLSCRLSSKVLKSPVTHLKLRN